MNKPVITIDIDGVIFDTPHWTTKTFNDKYGTSHEVADLFDHNARHNKDILATKAPEPSDDYVHYDHYHMTQKSSELYELSKGCKAALKTLSKQYTLIAITARNFDNFSEMTDELMKLHVGDFINEVVYTTEPNNPNKKKKGDLAKQLNSVCHIDDSVEYCLSCVKSGIPAILFTHSYNHKYDYPRGWRAKDWPEVVSIINKKVPA